ncbi:MAG TPA: ATP-dependent zinc metalloprotease FtsH [Verrucomicrobia bacterium]|nr:ATP-dependent zinc metalloprotease FtsH [Verrucomicrobiota bacterium]
MKLSRKTKSCIGVALLALGAVLLTAALWKSSSREITRADLTTLLTEQQIEKARLLPTPYAGIYRVEGTRLVGGKPERFHITTHLDEAQTRDLLSLSTVTIEMPGQGMKGQWVNIVSTLIIGGLIVGLILYQTNIGKARSAQVRERPSVRFTEVAGIEEAKGEVQEVVDFLRNPAKYRRLGGNLPKGVLLVGPPGTGKTMLAKAIACEADASFFSAHGSDFNEVFVGVGAKRVRQLFRQARKNRPAIIFIDEIDCVGKNRKFDTHGEHQQTINALLAAMDGFQSSEGIVVVAATNRPEDLDDALLRPGRFDRKVFVPYPDMKGRRAILQAHAEGKPIEDEAHALDVLARTTPGMSGADLANLINEAAILCAQKNAARITLADLEAARDKVRFGKERASMVLKQSEREMVAYHEAGHTILHLNTSLLPPLYKVSIVPRGQALGVTTLLPDEDQNLQSKQFLLEELRVLMGGRAAERLFFGSTTNGAAGDLDMARKIARNMIHEWGMGERLYYEREHRDAEIEINRLLETADRDAQTIIEAQRESTEKLARALLEVETLTREEVLALVGSEHPAFNATVSASDSIPSIRRMEGRSFD